MATCSARARRSSEALFLASSLVDARERQTAGKRLIRLGFGAA